MEGCCYSVVSTCLACVRTWVQFSGLQNNKNKLDTHTQPPDTCQPENKAGGTRQWFTGSTE